MSVPYLKSNSNVNPMALQLQINADTTINSTAVCQAVTWSPPDVVEIIMDSALSGAQETQLDALVAAHVGGSPYHDFDDKFRVDTYNTSNFIAKTTYYQVKTAPGVYANKTRDIVYTYSGQILLSYTTSHYDTAGNIFYREIVSYMQDRTVGAQRLIQEKS